MKTGHLSLLIAAAGIVAACATAPEQVDEMTLAEAAKEECRMIKEPGSILSKRVCNNKATWAAIEEQDREASEEAMRHVQDRWGPLPGRSGETRGKGFP